MIKEFIEKSSNKTIKSKKYFFRLSLMKYTVNYLKDNTIVLDNNDFYKTFYKSIISYGVSIGRVYTEEDVVNQIMILLKELIWYGIAEEINGDYILGDCNEDVTLSKWREEERKFLLQLIFS